MREHQFSQPVPNLCNTNEPSKSPGNLQQPQLARPQSSIINFESVLNESCPTNLSQLSKTPNIFHPLSFLGLRCRMPGVLSTSIQMVPAFWGGVLDHVAPHFMRFAALA